VYNNRIYVGDTRKGFFIDVFDNSGNRLYSINKKYEKIKMTRDHIKDIREGNKENDRLYTNLTGGKIKHVFRDFFPAYKDFSVQDDKLYVFTYRKKNGKREVIIMDLSGKELGRTFVTITRINTIANGRYYYLKDNIETEEWELWWQELK
jgi:hypothetical protein